MKEPRKAIVPVEELDGQTTNIPLAIGAILVTVDTAATVLANETKAALDPTDRSSLLTLASRASSAARELSLAASRLHAEAGRLEAAALFASHRAPWPTRKGASRRR